MGGVGRARADLVACLVGRDGQRVDECLGVLPTDTQQQCVNGLADPHVGRVYARDDLRNNKQPRVDVNGVEAFEKRGLNLRKAPNWRISRNGSRVHVMFADKMRVSRPERAAARWCGWVRGCRGGRRVKSHGKPMPLLRTGTKV